LSGRARIRVGTSGWSYDHWQGAFYPTGVKPSERLAWYATRFPTVEVNATFYRLPSEKVVRGWRDAVPPGFAFAVKGSRFITHYRKLVDVGDAVATFCGRLAVLGEKLRVVLWQLPPGLSRDTARLESFLGVLPGNLRHAVEFRETSWLTSDVFEVLRARNVAHVHVSSDAMPIDLTTTADFAYVRFHGLAGYHGEYVERALLSWGAFLCAERDKGHDAYVYFNNDANACAPRDAVRLQEMCAASRQGVGANGD